MGWMKGEGEGGREEGRLFELSKCSRRVNKNKQHAPSRASTRSGEKSNAFFTTRRQPAILISPKLLLRVASRLLRASPGLTLG